MEVYNGAAAANAPITQVAEDPKAWWFSNENKTFSSREITDLEIGFDKSIKYVEEFLDNQKDAFDGLLGFSQGASFVQLLLSKIGTKYNFRFIILFSAFKSVSTAHKDFIEKPLTIPSFHVCGLSDEIVNFKRSEELAEIFHASVIIKHKGKHCIPPIACFKNELLQFF